LHVFQPQLFVGEVAHHESINKIFLILAEVRVLVH